jgi:hypothetical protein
MNITILKGVSKLLSSKSTSKYPWDELEKADDGFFVPLADMPPCFQSSEGKQGRPHCPPRFKKIFADKRLAIRSTTETLDGVFGSVTYLVTIK